MSSSLQKASWRDPVLGEQRELDLPQGQIRYFEVGEGPAIVFVHGLLVNANLWRKVVALLAPDFRCIVLDMPLGSHTRPMAPGADLSLHAVVDLIADAIAAITPGQVTLVGNDSGGALSQMVVTRRPEQIGRLVLTPCDYRDNFPPAMFALFSPAASVPGMFKALINPMRLGVMRRLPIAFGWLVKRPIDRQAEDSYIYPSLAVPGVEHDVKKFIRGIDKRYSNEAADLLGTFERPALIAWSREDRFFKAADGEQLARDLPDARLEWVDDSRSFSPEDNPMRLAALIGGFVREGAQVPAG